MVLDSCGESVRDGFDTLRDSRETVVKSLDSLCLEYKRPDFIPRESSCDNIVKEQGNSSRMVR